MSDSIQKKADRAKAGWVHIYSLTLKYTQSYFRFNSWRKSVAIPSGLSIIYQDSLLTLYHILWPTLHPSGERAESRQRVLDITGFPWFSSPLWVCQYRPGAPTPLVQRPGPRAEGGNGLVITCRKRNWWHLYLLFAKLYLFKPVALEKYEATRADCDYQKTAILRNIPLIKLPGFKPGASLEIKR